MEHSEILKPDCKQILCMMFQGPYALFLERGQNFNSFYLFIYFNLYIKVTINISVQFFVEPSAWQGTTCLLYQFRNQIITLMLSERNLTLVSEGFFFQLFR